MKTLFISLWLTLGLAGCVDLEAEPLPGSTGDETSGAPSTTATRTGVGPGTSQGPTTATGASDEATADESGSETGCGDNCGADHGLRGELIVFVNARLSSAEAAYQSNMPLGDAGTFLGPSLYIYDPLAECDDGTSSCRLARLGQLRLDDRLGPVSVADGSLQKFTLVDLAWSADEGLWGISFDVKNDEWGIALLDVRSFAEEEAEIGVERYAILPGDPVSPGTDPCYWQEAVSGLGFADGNLLLGVRGVGGSGIPPNGMVYRIALDVVLEQGHCTFANDVSQDPNYYACDVLCQPWSRFDPQVGIAGDLVANLTGAGALAIVRVEDDTLGPLDRAELYTISSPTDVPSVPQATGVFAEPVPQGLDIEGLATVDGRLFGIDVWGKIHEFDVERQVVLAHDDLSPLFDDFTQSLKVRGATTVVVP